MIRVLVLANDSLLAAGIVSTLAEEIDLDVIRLTHRELGKEDHSVVIVVDEGGCENESIKVADLFRDRTNLIVIMLSLKSCTLYIYESYQLVNPGMEQVYESYQLVNPGMEQVYESYQLVNPGMEQVIHIIREFSKMILKKNPDDHRLTKADMLSFKKVVALFYSPFLHSIRRKNVRNVTLLNSSGRSSGFDIWN